jgi:hypothetical protein
LILLPGLIDPANEAVFLMRFRDPRANKMLFRFRPSMREDVALFKRVNLGSGDASHMLCSYSSGTLRNLATLLREEKIGQPNFNLKVDIPNKRRVDIEAEISYNVQADSLRWLRLSPLQKFREGELVIRGGDGEELYWQQSWATGDLVVFLGRPSRKGSQGRITLLYSSEKILKWSKEFDGATVDRDWYPSLESWQPASYRAEFRYPKDYRVICVGEQIVDTVEGDMRLSEWSTLDTKQFRITFDIARYHCDTTLSSRGIAVVSYYPEKKDETWIIERRRFSESVTEAVSLFDSLLAPYPYTKLVVASSPVWRGEVFPGYIRFPDHSMLYQWLYEMNTSSVWSESMIGSAVASQWLDYLVYPRSGRDLWLRTGMSEYLGAFYCEARHQGDTLRNLHYLQKVDEWKSSLAASNAVHRLYAARDTLKKDTLAGGSASDSLTDYYQESISPTKGAYVLHMLRYLMRDIASHDDSAFIKMISDFLKVYAFEPVTTDDFKKMAEAYYGADLTWFFNEYVYGTSIPLFRWQVVCDTTAASPIVTILVDTEHAPPSYSMPIPFAVVMEDNQVAYIRLEMDQPTKQFRFSIPSRPKDFIFNARNAVLCEDERIR